MHLTNEKRDLPKMVRDRERKAKGNAPGPRFKIHKSYIHMNTISYASLSNSNMLGVCNVASNFD